MGRAAIESAKRRQIAYACAIIFGLLVFIYLLQRPSGATETITTPVAHNSFIFHPSQSHVISAEDIQLRSRSMHLERKSFESPDAKARVDEAVSRCSQLTQHEQLLDSECSSIWTHHLRSGEIKGVEKWWGFVETHNGAITLDLGRVKAMFKPCTSKGEDTSKEVIASYLDQLLQWGQTAPVITRKIPIDELKRFLVTDNDFENWEETVEDCAIDGYFVGPMIGWWDSLIPIRTVNKKDLSYPELATLRSTLSNHPLPAQMQSKYHAFYWLINILRHGKDEFVTNHGDLVSLDLDRSRYGSTKPIAGPALNYTWCHTCYMDEWVYDTFTAVGPAQRESDRLGYLMREVLAHEDIFEGIWDTRLGEALDKRVAMLLDCTNKCISRFGADNVLLREDPNSMSPKELVEYFVKNSAYKNMNGKRGPSDLEFLNDLED